MGRWQGGPTRTGGRGHVSKAIRNRRATQKKSQATAAKPKGFRRQCTGSKFNNTNPVAPIHRFQLVSIRSLWPVGRNENVFGLQFFHQLAHQSALELGLSYAMPRVKVN